ncbi:YopT-type cysteine protease domain-containing protein [Microbulbifer sp. A4B17]|uniref:YopT-type cysteine protease domain-containing protein n=1 Tax=Microbulbifer sp. A4B17 TaxID=359370 RepID=UPI0013005ED0|nr:YopT-type cysteine protease domain-containing protein [Microbulbifer sp. A4B17]
MPIWFDKTVLALTGTRVGPVQRSVAQHGGTLQYNFSQCLDPVKAQITIHQDTAGGVCESLSAHWIKFHAEDDSLWNWLFPNGALSEQHLFHVMTLHQIGGNAPNQDQVSEAWLQSHNVLPLQNNGGVGIAGPNGRRQIHVVTGPRLDQGQTTMRNSAALADEIIREPTRSAGSYKKIGISGKVGAHAMAAWVAEDVLFFDPNFGEFWFPTKNAFRNWFVNSFWNTSMYAIGLSGSYDVRCYAHAT